MPHARTNGSRLVDRIALAVAEQRLELGLSLNELGRLSGVSRATIARLERGKRVDPALVVRVGATLNTLELAPKEEQPDPVVLEFKRDAERAVDDFGRELDRWVVDSLGAVMPDGAA